MHPSEHDEEVRRPRRAARRPRPRAPGAPGRARPRPATGTRIERTSPPWKPISTRATVSGTAHQLRQHTVHGVGMDERHLETVQARGAARDRRAARLRRRAGRARRGGRPPRTRRGACPARGGRGTVRSACRRRAAPGARPCRRRRAARPPRRPATRSSPEPLPCPEQPLVRDRASSRSATATPM